MKALCHIVLFGLCLGYQAVGQATSGIAELNRQLGRGINLGNMFEAPSENEWGNPYRSDYFQRIFSLGFRHVRIPIRWDTPQRAQLVPPYTLDAAFLRRIRLVIDEAHQQGLYVIINMHHHEELFTHPERAKPRFLAQWEQIAAYFKDYDEKLLFEVLNEPNGQLTPELWNEYFAEALGKIRKTNPTRAVVMGLALYGGLAGVPYLKPPADPRLIVSVHYYNPFRFTHQGAEWVGSEAQNWLGTSWKDLDTERDEIRQEFEPLVKFGQKHQLPIHVGEFGAYQKADMASRQRWTTFLARWFEEQGFSWAYWEFSAGFGIFNPGTNQYVQPLVDALLKSPMPPAKSQFGVTLYESNFATGSQGWTIQAHGEASATMQLANKAIVVDIRRVTAQSWQVQLLKDKLTLVKNRQYRVSVRGFSSVPHTFTVYAGKASAPYNSYSGYKSLSFNEQEKENSFVFVMNDDTDPGARLVFDLGTGLANLHFTSVKVEELFDEITGTDQELPTAGPYAMPNPADKSVEVHGVRLYQQLRVLTTQGVELLNRHLTGEETCTLDIRTLATGLYVLELTGDGGKIALKLLKK
jgi:endoglucanase